VLVVVVAPSILCIGRIEVNFGQSADHQHWHSFVKMMKRLAAVYSSAGCCLLQQAAPGGPAFQKDHTVFNQFINLNHH